LPRAARGGDAFAEVVELAAARGRGRLVGRRRVARRGGGQRLGEVRGAPHVVVEPVRDLADRVLGVAQTRGRRLREPEAHRRRAQPVQRVRGPELRRLARRAPRARLLP